MSQTDDSSYDCLLVVSHGIVTNKERINSKLAQIAKDEDTEMTIICPWQIWYFLEREEFGREDQCIPILQRNPETEATSVVEIVEETSNICKEQNFTRVGIIAHPDEFEECLNLFLKRGINAFILDASR